MIAEAIAETSAETLLAAARADAHRAGVIGADPPGLLTGSMPMNSMRAAFTRLRVLLAGTAAVCIAGLAIAGLPIATTHNDFILGGTQPNELPGPLNDTTECTFCHGYFNSQIEPLYQWRGSMMSQAARDPLFKACLAIANQDAVGSGDICIRCHSPIGWLAGRSTPPDGSALLDTDREGVNCAVCHRMVDPVYVAGVSPAGDEAILNSLAIPPGPSRHTGMYVMDPVDNRRGPFADATCPHATVVDDFFQQSQLCATCHDVSNPVYSRRPDGTYALNDLDTQAPTFDKTQMFPIERTFGEWSMSAFAVPPGVDMGGRFGGNKTVVGTCQDCHMPDATGKACGLGVGKVRDDQPVHAFSGGNAWVPDVIIRLQSPPYTPDPNVDVAALADGKLRAIAMLQAAATVTAQQVGDVVVVHVTNETGHKLPTGYPEGRRMWLNARFFDAGASLVDERGAYDASTATLTTTDTKVYEARLGIDAAVSAATGIAAGETFHFVLNNMYVKDNRIPPRGFTNAGFEAVQAAPVAYHYADGQYWDDTCFRVPPGATSVEIRLYYQTSSREYIEFLRDENTTTNDGQLVYDLWAETGKSTPVEMAVATVPVDASLAYGDFDSEGDVDLADFATFLACFNGPIRPIAPGCCAVDNDMDGDVDLADFAAFLACFNGPNRPPVCE